MADTVTSLLGDMLVPPALSEENQARLEAEWQAAVDAARERPDDPDAQIWLGRRAAYLGNYRDAIATFTAGIARFPRDARLYRHRGHRYITVREFDLALADFQTAARLIAGRPDEVEPDGRPSVRGVPTSTLHFNIWYHLALTHYLRGAFAEALSAYGECLAVSETPEKLVATSHWLYMTLRRLGREAEASRVLEPVHAGLDVVENAPYHRLLLMYRGELTPEALLGEADGGNPDLNDATAGYGIGNWHFYNGQRAEAEEWFRRVYAGEQWAAFGAIAAEAELARLIAAG